MFSKKNVRYSHYFLKGFTLVELLLVIAIIAIVGATAIPIGSSFLVRTHVKNKTNELVSSLRTAQINSINGKADSQWGVSVANSKITLYANNNTALNQVFSIPTTISITQNSILFDKITGTPNAPKTFTITSNIGKTTTVTVNEIGTVDVK